MSLDFLKKGPVLVLAPHPDDELGCGGTLARLAEAGADIHHYYFAGCEQSLRELGLPEDALVEECRASLRTLGIDPDRGGRFNFPVRYFQEHRQQILEELTVLKKKISPSVIFTPNSQDIHQDHHCIYQETLRAFKHVTILGYELPWNTLTMHHDCLVSLTQAHIDKKIEAVLSYKSQSSRVYANRDFFESLARVRGVQANTQYAECFEVIRLIM